MRLLKTPLFDAEAVTYASDSHSDAASVASAAESLRSRPHDDTLSRASTIDFSDIDSPSGQLRQRNVSPQARRPSFDVPLARRESFPESESKSESESDDEYVASTTSSSESDVELLWETVWSAEWTPELVEFSGREIPQYAILSHTWQLDEVLYRDVALGTSTDRAGYQKLKLAATQARVHGYCYIWIDTCCIDKNSSAELQEAINSMFTWYAQAETCYAYLSDVTCQRHQPGFEAAFSNSRWFTRGWTLQELLAPRNVFFFTESWHELGNLRGPDDEALQKLVSRTTGIARYYLLAGRPLTRANVATRMRWASGRATARTEDIAYCLLGLFDISMPLLYGEGKKAFRRLQEEIMKQSDDLSLFSWTKKSSDTMRHGLLSDSPADFARYTVHGRLLAKQHGRDLTATTPYAMTNVGLSIELRLKPIVTDMIYLALLERQKADNESRSAIYLQRMGGTRFVRILCNKLPSALPEEATATPCLIWQDIEARVSAGDAVSWHPKIQFELPIPWMADFEVVCLTSGPYTHFFGNIDRETLSDQVCSVLVFPALLVLRHLKTSNEFVIECGSLGHVTVGYNAHYLPDLMREISDVEYVSGLPATESHVAAIKRHLRAKRPNLKIAGMSIEIPIKSHEVLVWKVTTWVRRFVDKECYVLTVDIQAPLKFRNSEPGASEAELELEQPKWKTTAIEASDSPLEEQRTHMDAWNLNHSSPDTRVEPLLARDSSRDVSPKPTGTMSRTRKLHWAETPPKPE
ncbi:hypothetical protein CKM354_001182000 [Cercospora kikuchii]|uniref:Heterokaryon incompatibility domain-containing protein n=1 Tax=Cercospora kikuchii TaxID=84275 RepID=A0A9P3CW65_9PEZI|nr:uncharacterized protein CKM354_001182000 [Cercospora kikuchii]GIZ48772.1 hypothetical protein CKM354_001182000 [Cercospora kikuchii]